jgi:hypothetical protein
VPRVVLVHASGLRRIIGIFDPNEHVVNPLITFPEGAFEVGPRCARAGLVSADHKVIYYREIPE